jgi:hypothetical protein
MMNYAIVKITAYVIGNGMEMRPQVFSFMWEGSANWPIVVDKSFPMNEILRFRNLAPWKLFFIGTDKDDNFLFVRKEYFDEVRS